MKRVLPACLLAVVLAPAARAEAPPQAAFLPTPYSAEQIREAWQPGLRVETHTSDENGASRRRLSVLAADAEGCTIRSEALAAEGSPGGEVRDFSSRWSELRDHARFEAAKATRERAECRSGLGAQPGWRYATTDSTGAAVTMCFADATPGPPVEHEVQREGRRISRTEHTHYGRPSGAEEAR
jgi:hypothetical protein